MPARRLPAATELLVLFTGPARAQQHPHEEQGTAPPPAGIGRVSFYSHDYLALMAGADGNRPELDVARRFAASR
jgi:hypothetical protein